MSLLSRLPRFALLVALLLRPSFTPAAETAWQPDRDPVWQWSVPTPSIPERRAFL